jgi:hypothetical protein
MASTTQERFDRRITVVHGIEVEKIQLSDNPDTPGPEIVPLLYDDSETGAVRPCEMAGIAGLLCPWMLHHPAMLKRMNEEQAGKAREKAEGVLLEFLTKHGF